MRVALGMIVLNDIVFIKRHFAKISPQFEKTIVIDGGSNDGTFEELSAQPNTEITVNQWNGDFSAQRNELIKSAESKGFDWLFILDADELISPQGIADAKTFMTADNEFLVFPRIEFFGDPDHYRHNLYPDYQGRGIKLNIGYHFRNPLHEMVYKGGENHAAVEMNHHIIVPSALIYHYGWAIEPFKKHMRYLNIDRLAHGLPPMYELEVIEPDWLALPGLKKFEGRHPYE
jgi:glycosyltransferase involved in cell wall biosynthesis